MSQTNILLESGTNELEIVEFFVNEVQPDGSIYTGYYGVNVAKVLEIIRMPQVTEMPEASHECVLGAFNLRSRIIPLVDLSLWLGRKMADDDAPKVVVTEFNNVTNAFKVSGVNRIHRISWEQVEPPTLQLSQYTASSITGVVKFDERIILILDMEKIVADLNPGLALNLDAVVSPVRKRPEPKPVVEVVQQAGELPEESVVEDIPEEPEYPTVRVLIADDSTMIRRTIGKGLEKVGFEVERTINGKVAWEKLIEIKEKAEEEGKDITEVLNIIVSDIEMPVMDGHNLCKRIKGDPVLQKLPVILFSSLITERLRHKGEAVGADEQISKPDIVTLTDRIKAILTERQGLEF